MAIITDVLKNLNLFVDGNNYAGKVESLELPKLTLVTEEVRTGGMNAPIEIDMGQEKLEATFTLVSYDSEVLKLFGLQAGNRKSLTVRGSLEGEDGKQKPIKVEMTGLLRELDMGTWTPGEKATLGFTATLTYYKLEHDSNNLIEIDVPGMKRIINGVDQLAIQRANLGL